MGEVTTEAWRGAAGEKGSATWSSWRVAWEGFAIWDRAWYYIIGEVEVSICAVLFSRSNLGGWNKEALLLGLVWCLYWA